MKSVKLAVIAALSSFAVSAFALSPMQDSDLSAVSGQDGVSIAAQMNISVGEFKYTAVGTDPNAATMSMKNINITGAIAATIDILTATQFQSDAHSVLGVGGTGSADVNTAGTSLLRLVSVADQAAAPAAFLPATDDVVKIAIPNIAANKVNITVGSTQFGNGSSTTAAGTIGRMEIKDLQLQGTTAYIWLHKG